MSYDNDQSKVTQEEFEYSQDMIKKLSTYFECGCRSKETGEFTYNSHSG